MQSPSPIRVADAYRRSKASVRGKTSGEVRFIKDKGSDHNEWAWNQGPNEREITKDFVFNARYLKPLATVLRSALMALGHATSAHNRFVKIKSRNVSPDGSLGGRGYIQKIPDMRRQIMNCVEVLSSLTDTIYDEMHAPHWNPAEDTLDPRDRDEVKEIVQDVEEINADPEGWAEGEEEEEDPTGRTARVRSSLRTKLLSVDTAISNLRRQVDNIAEIAEALRGDSEMYEKEGDLEDPEFLAVVEAEAEALAKLAWELHKKASFATYAAKKATFSRPRRASAQAVAGRYLVSVENPHVR